MKTGTGILLAGLAGGGIAYAIGRKRAKDRGFATTAFGATIFGVPHQPKGAMARGRRVVGKRAVAPFRAQLQRAGKLPRPEQPAQLSATTGNYYTCTCPNGQRILCGGGESCAMCCRRHALTGQRSSMAITPTITASKLQGIRGEALADALSAAYMCSLPDGSDFFESTSPCPAGYIQLEMPEIPLRRGSRRMRRLAG